MPITYPPGVMKEHLHTREHAGLFDISHMRLFELSGPGAAALLDRACPLEAGALELSQSKYTFFLNEKAGIIDDLIVTRLGLSASWSSPMPATPRPTRRICSKLASGFRLQGRRRSTASSWRSRGLKPADVLSRIGIETDALTFMHGIELRPGWFMSRSGYTGEDGFEIGLPEADGARAGRRSCSPTTRVMWIGLAARDSLRLEAGLCLHGQDITPRHRPGDVPG